MNTCWPLRTSPHLSAPLCTLHLLYSVYVQHFGFLTIVHWIMDEPDIATKNPWWEMKDLVKTYITIQKSSKTVKIWPFGWAVKMVHFHYFNFGHLWQLITSATGARRGSTFGSIKGLDLLYEWLKHSICGSRLWPFAAQLKLQKTRNFNKVLWGNG